MFKYPAYRMDRLITKLGPLVTLRQTTNTFDVATQTSSTPVVTTFNISGVVSQLSTEFPPSEKTDVQDTVYEVLISNRNLGTTPQPGDEVIFGCVTYRVLRADPGYIGQSIDSWALSLKA